MQPYLLGIYEKAMPDEWQWPVKMEQAAKHGFDFIEMSIDESDERQSRLSWSADKRKKFAQEALRGIPVSSICLSAHRKYTIGSHYEDIRKRGMQIMESAIELAYDLGIRIIQLAGYDVYYYESSDEESKKYFTENLALSAEMAAARGIMLGLETMENSFMDTCEKAMEFVNITGSPYLGIYPDIGNICNAKKGDSEKAACDLRIGHGHIFSAHLKETDEGIYRNMMYGDGRVDFPLIADCLIKMNVRRFTAEFWHLSGRNAEADMEYAGSFLRNILNNATGLNLK